jgi:hypothetical protein
MSTAIDFKICRKGIHEYSADLKHCPECRKISTKNWREANKERHQENIRKWKQANQDRIRESDRLRYKINRNSRLASSKRRYELCKKHILKRNREWRQANPERTRQYQLHWRKTNPKKAKEVLQKIQKSWRKAHPDKVRSHAARRRALKKHATPAWADINKINQIYAEALRLQNLTGQLYHVDHIYPLSSPYMCGLHVETNLQIISAEENMKKSNKTWPGQLPCQKTK